MRQVATELHRRLVRCHGAVAVREHAGQVQLDEVGELRVLCEELVERLRQVDVRAREDVDILGRSAEDLLHERRAPMPFPPGGVHRPGVDDPERRVGSRRRKAGEVGGVEAVRDRDDDSFSELREGPHQLRGRLGRVHDDGFGRPEQLAHAT
jgi:hypothetical protein